jgi:superfamily II DNA or RNA helicase
VNLRVFELPEAIKRNFIKFTESLPRPYTKPRNVAGVSSRWNHQREALATFLQKRHGVLEMATGTGKTRTALSIVNELRERNLVRTAIVTAYGTDLLDQWHKELLRHTQLHVYRAYERYSEAQSYINHYEGAALLISRQALHAVLQRLGPDALREGILVCDEVHGMGSPALVAALKGKLSPFAFTLGLSATPEREYDAEGNRFIEDEIGPVIFKFGLQKAIQRGILCELDYFDLEYEFSDDDRMAVRDALRRYHGKLNEGTAPQIEVLYQ